MLHKQFKSAKVLALIPARGGSKTLPRKNILPVAGRPLIAWTIEAALTSQHIDTVAVSSDDIEILEVASSWESVVSISRPAPLASDTANSVDVVLHALDYLKGHDIIMLLQPTSPLRNSHDIDTAIELMIMRSAPACVSVCPSQYSPYWMFNIDDTDKLQSIVGSENIPSRRQDLAPAYMPNGALYIARTEWLRRTKSFFAPGAIAYIMPSERSLDIDTRSDFDRFTEMISK